MRAQLPSPGTVTAVPTDAARGLHCEGLRIGVIDEVAGDRPDGPDGPASPQCRRIFVDGELDIATVASLDAVLERAPASVCIDLSGLTFCDVAGLNMLLAARERTIRAGHGFVLVGAPAQLRQLLNMTAAWESFTVEFGELPPRPVAVPELAAPISG
jgi:anti-anti-sigma factor